MAADQLAPLDAAFLEIEQSDECSHMHIGWAMVFEPGPGGRTPTVQEVRALLDARLDAMPRFRKRLSHQRAGGLRWPRWEPDPGFDIAGHVRHATLPSPGGDPELAERLYRAAASREAPATVPAAELALAELLLERRRAEEAVAQLEHLILTYPESALVPQARRMLDQARGAVPRT